MTDTVRYRVWPDGTVQEAWGALEFYWQGIEDAEKHHGIRAASATGGA